MVYAALTSEVLHSLHCPCVPIIGHRTYIRPFCDLSVTPDQMSGSRRGAAILIGAQTARMPMIGASLLAVCKLATVGTGGARWTAAYVARQ